MIAECWGERVVSEDAITRILSKVRQLAALSTPAAFELQTLPKVGVRLIAAGEPPQPRSPDPVLIVPPFDNLSGAAELEFFSDGVAEEVLGRLVRGSALKVIGRTTSFQYRGARKADAAGELNASHIVDGAVQRAGDRVRISVHLTEAATGAAAWSQRFDRDLHDIFAL